MTGCSGYVGASVVTYLRQRHPDAYITGLDTGLFADQHEGVGPASETILDRWLVKDVRDVDLVDLTGVTHLIQLAAVSNDPMGDRFADVTYDINYHSVVRMAGLAKAAGASTMVLASSASVYGMGSTEPRSETSKLLPQTAYARSKIAAETDLRLMAGEGFTVSALRFSTACGWSSRVRLDLVLNDFVASALTTGVIKVLSDGSPWRPLIHINDMARAITWAISAERTNADAFVAVNVGNDDWNFQIRDLAHAVSDVLGGVVVDINSNAQPDSRSYRLDFSKWRELAPDSQPQMSLENTIEELKRGLEQVSNLDSDFRNSRRMRLRRLLELRELGFLDEDLRWTVRVGTK